MIPTLAVTALAILAQLLPYQPKVSAVTFLQPGMPGIRIDGTPHAMVCNMPMLRPQYHVDPKIVVEPPKGVDYKIRIIEAPRCQ